jgi:alpha-tubulin suppressor-like RCC1 family protein
MCGQGFRLPQKQTVRHRRPISARATVNKGSESMYAVKSTKVRATLMAAVLAGVFCEAMVTQSEATENAWAWGQNEGGELGNGTTTSNVQRKISKVSGLSNITAVAAGDHLSLFLKSDGTVWGCGQGLIGDGSNVRQTVPVQASGLTGIVAISKLDINVLDGFTLALKNDGTVWAWGVIPDANGAFNTQTTPIQVQGLSGITAIAAGLDHALALKNDGTVWIWGNCFHDYDPIEGTIQFDTVVTPIVVRKLSGEIFSGAKGITAGFGNSFIIKNDGSVWSWGSANSVFDLNWEPTQVPNLTNVKSVCANYNYAVALKTDGTVWAWGQTPFSSILGPGTGGRQVKGLTDVRSIDIGGDYKYWCLLFSKNDGTIWSLGGWRGAFGITSFDTNVPKQGLLNDPTNNYPPMTGVVSVSAGYNHGLAATICEPKFSPTNPWFESTLSVTLSSDTSDVTFYYTTNGDTPTTSSTLYTGPFTLTDTTTIKAISVKYGSIVSMVSTTTYNILPVEAPTFSVPSGTYGTPQTVALSCATPGATIYYFIQGVSTTWTTYTTPLTFSTNTILDAYASKPGRVSSYFTRATYNFLLPTPTFSPGSGNYIGPQTVTISCAESGATIHYWINDGTPAIYTSPVTIYANVNGGLTFLRAYASKSGKLNSLYTDAFYVIGRVSDPTFSYNSGTYTNPISVTISCATPGAIIYYTTDGTLPTTSSLQYISPISVAQTTKIGALATKSGAANSSFVWADYNITTVATPTFSLAPGTYVNPQTVSLSCLTPGAAIYYTTDGSTPTTSSAQYSGPLSISNTMTIKTLAAKSGMINSAVASGIYYITPPTTPKFNPEPGIYPNGQSVTITTPDFGATIYYTTDGSTPTTASNQYAGSINVSATTILKAIAVRSGQTSTVAFAPYAIGNYTVRSWGNNTYGQLGDGSNTRRLTAVQMTGIANVKAVSGQGSFTIILKNDGTVWACGLNNYGQLGNGTTTNSLTPLQVNGLSDVKAISAGDAHSLALKNDGTVWAWGMNLNGPLGDNTTTDRLLPVQVNGLSGVVAIAGGYRHSMALKNDGTVWGWGSNTNGQLGDGTTTQRLLPVQVNGLSNVISIATGRYSGLALTNDGFVWAWGQNSNGQLGDGTTTQRLTPVRVSGIANVTNVGTGAAFSMALKDNGTVWAWGSNSSGQLGNGTTTQSLLPVQVSNLSSVTFLAVGGAHALALKNDGNVSAWGDGSYGVLGDGTLLVNRLTPVQVVNLPRAVSIAAGGRHSLAIAQNQSPVGSTQTVSTTEDVLVSIVLSGSDSDGDSLTYSVLTQPSNGVLTGTTPNLTYTPNANFNGSDSFTFKVNDGVADSNTATVSITVTAVNDAPIVVSAPTASPAPALVGENISFAVLATDVEGDTISYDWNFNDGTTASGSNPVHAYGTAGNYTVVVTISDGNGGLTTETISVGITTPLPSNASPNVSLTAPANGSRYATPAAIAMTATATDTDGTIAKVEFYQGTTLLTTDTTAPYGYAWSNVGVGTYTLTAKAYDNKGLDAVSAPVTVTVVPTVTLSVTDAWASEPSTDTGKFRISRTGATTTTLTVYYTLGGMAGNGTDYASLFGSATIPTGSTYVDVTITPTDDTLVEGKESVIMTLSANPTYLLGVTTVGTVNLLDNELPVLTVSVSDGWASEPGTDTGKFTVTRTGAKTAALTVSYTMSGTATNGVDYATLSGSVVIPAGAASAAVTVTPLDDALLENKETVTLTIAENAAYQTGATISGSLTLMDDEMPIISIAATDTLAAEPADVGTFTITRGGKLDAAVTVNYTTGGSAVKGTDYATLGGSVTIPAGATSAVVTITPIDDLLVEGKEYVSLSLTANAAYQTNASTSATLYIWDDEKPEVTLTATDAAAAETNADVGTLKVSCFPAAKANLTVLYTIGGTATAGTDYTALAGSVVIPTGATSATVTVTPVDDVLVESTETVTAALSVNASYQNGSPRSGTVNITDNEPTVSVSAVDSSAAETATGVTANPGAFRLTRTNGTTPLPLVVNYTVTGTATAGTDYTALAGSATIPVGATYVDVAVTPMDDFLYEGNETVVLTVASSTTYRLGTSAATVTILENESTVSLSVSDGYAVEPGTDKGSFTVSRSGGSNVAALTVNYTVTGTATAGTDYTALAGSVTISAGASSAAISVAPLNDTLAEGLETVVVTLTANPMYKLGTSSGTVKLYDDEPPIVTVGVADAWASELGADTGSFTVYRTGSTTAALTVKYATSGTATHGTDYANLSGLVTIPAGATSAVVTVTPLNDILVENKETVTLTVTDDAAYQTGTIISGTLNLLDDETPIISISATDATAAETGDTGTFTITRTGKLDPAVTVTYTTGGSATKGVDYATPSGSVTIPAGATSATVVITPLDDTLVEGTETVTLSLSANAAYQLTSVTAATVNLTSND